MQFTFGNNQKYVGDREGLKPYVERRREELKEFLTSRRKFCLIPTLIYKPESSAHKTYAWFERIDYYIKPNLCKAINLCIGSDWPFLDMSNNYLTVKQSLVYNIVAPGGANQARGLWYNKNSHDHSYDLRGLISNIKKFEKVPHKEIYKIPDWSIHINYIKSPQMIVDLLKT